MTTKVIEGVAVTPEPPERFFPVPLAVSLHLWLDRHMATTKNTFPALTGAPVTQAHVNTCTSRGHATHAVDGINSEVCPRCGTVTKASATYESA